MGASAGMAARLVALRRAEAREAQAQAREREAADRRAAAQTLDAAERAARAQGEHTDRTEEGAVRVLSRDGLLWLTAKGRLSPAQKSAAERYRADYERTHRGVAPSSLEERVAGLGAGRSAGYSPSEAQHRALWSLDAARDKALNRDPGLVRLMDEVAGKGATLRDLAQGDKHLAGRLEIELGVACRMLARHYGFSG